MTVKNIKWGILCLLFCMVNQGFTQQNCILIIADDVSPDYFGCFSPTTDTAKMPTIAQLAQNGIRFTNVWAAPVCSPTRAGILTGRYSFRTGVGQVITANTSPQLDTAERTIAELLQQYAPTPYHTGLAGKWHLHNNAPAKRLNPNKMGFDFYKGNFNGALQDYFTYPIIVNGQTDTAYEYATTQTVNDAIGWLDTVNSTKPFFLWLAFNAPHSPYHLPPATLCEVTGLSGTPAHINANKPLYFKAALQAMDTEIGRLLQYLQAKGWNDSTNIIFIGDNGNSPDVAQNGNPAHCKNTIYNYGVNVPMIVNGPAVVSPDRDCHALVNTQDIFATVAALCAFPDWKSSIPASTPIDSKSFLPYIKNENLTVRDWIFTEQFTDIPAATDGKTIRNAQYQLMKFDNGTQAFYDLQADINQNNDLLTQTLTPTQLNNFNFLCDSLNALLGTNTCTLPVKINAPSFSGIQVFPNPCEEVLHIKLTENEIGSKVTTINPLGIKILTFTCTDVHPTVRLDGMDEGLYFLKIQLGQKERVEKILIKK